MEVHKKLQLKKVITTFSDCSRIDLNDVQRTDGERQVVVATKDTIRVRLAGRPGEHRSGLIGAFACGATALVDVVVVP
jgi:hypothetical protein